tara:strand:+ start:99 stop:350 length:252 start_codon:yes stop_codon:yes gene_type:complete
MSTSEAVLKSVSFTEEEHNLVFNLLQDHLEEIMEDEFFHIENHDQAEKATQLTVDTLRSMKNYNPDMTAEEAFGDGSLMGLTA